MKKICDHIYEYEYSVKIMPFVRFPVRTTFIEVNDNEILVISPGRFGESEIKEFLAPYSKIYCVAPNALHHIYLMRFKSYFPDVEIYGPQSIVKKQSWLESELKDISELSQIEEVELYPVEGNPYLDETVIYHKKTKTLVFTDLVFYMKAPMSFGLKMILKLVKAYNVIAQSGLVKKTTRNSEAFLASTEKIKKIKAERIVIGHGSVLSTSEEIQRAFEVI